MDKNNRKYLIAAVFFLALQVLMILRNIAYKDYLNFFWFCDSVPILFAIAFFLKKDQIIKGLINFGLIPQNVYVIGLLLNVFFGIHIPFVGPLNGLSAIILTLIPHLFSANVAFLFTYKIKPKPVSFIYSTIYLIFIGLSTILFTPASRNLNLVYHINPIYSIQNGAYLWFILAFLSTLPNYAIQYLIYKYSAKKK